MSATLQGKRALVTGGSRGIGAAIVKRLAAEGAHVALTYASSPDQAKQVAQSAQALGVQSVAIHADGSDPTAAATAIEQTIKELGGIDILVNNAGIAVIKPLDQLTLEDFDRTFGINVRAVYATTLAAVKHMTSGGRVINIGSCNADRMPFAGGAAYSMSKAALVGLVKGLSRDLGPRGITVNNIQPGPIETDMNPANGPFAKTLLGLMSVPRYGQPSEIAAMVVYLAGPDAGYITGASLTIDGGFTA